MKKTLMKQIRLLVVRMRRKMTMMMMMIKDNLHLPALLLTELNQLQKNKYWSIQSPLRLEFHKTEPTSSFPLTTKLYEFGGRLGLRLYLTLSPT